MMLNLQSWRCRSILVFGVEISSESNEVVYFEALATTKEKNQGGLVGLTSSCDRREADIGLPAHAIT